MLQLFQLFKSIASNQTVIKQCLYYLVQQPPALSSFTGELVF